MRRILMLLFASSILWGCYSTSEKQTQEKKRNEAGWSKAKSYMLSSDKMICTQDGGSIIVENGNKKYRIYPNGERRETKTIYHR